MNIRFKPITTCVGINQKWETHTFAPGLNRGAFAAQNCDFEICGGIFYFSREDRLRRQIMFIEEFGYLVPT